MLNYFIRRLLLTIPTFLGCTLVVFLILQITPGGPYDRALDRFHDGGYDEVGGSGARMDQMEIPESAKRELRRFFDLDRPIHERYIRWLGKLVQGDFGRSYVTTEPVVDIIVSKFPVSIYFGLIGFLLIYLVCIPLGIVKAVRHGSAFDLISSSIVFIGYSIPGWALGAFMLAFFGRRLGWFPIGEFRSEEWEQLSIAGKIWDQTHHTVLPILCYMVGSFATLTILMKNSLLENLGQDYIRTAYAKGLAERRVLLVHALRNSLIPIVTGLGSIFGVILAGSVLIERTFNIDGMGLLGYKAAVERDYTVVMGILVISVIVQLLGNLLSDILYAVVDPRIRFT